MDSGLSSSGHGRAFETANAVIHASFKRFETDICDNARHGFWDSKTGQLNQVLMRFAKFLGQQKWDKTGQLKSDSVRSCNVTDDPRYRASFKRFVTAKFNNARHSFLQQVVNDKVKNLKENYEIEGVISTALKIAI